LGQAHVTLSTVRVTPHKPESAVVSLPAALLLNLVRSNEGILDDSGEEHIRSKSDRVLSARANKGPEIGSQSITAEKDGRVIDSRYKKKQIKLDYVCCNGHEIQTS
jgi:hypothetical protein